MLTIRLFTRVAIAAAALSLIVTSSGMSSAGAGANRCDVLTRREVQRAIGHPVTVAEAPSGVGGRCSFVVKGAPTDMVNVWVLDGDDAEAGFEVGKQIGGEDAVRVPKLGRDSVYIGDPLNTAYVLEDGTLVYLQYYVFSGDDSAKDIKRAVVTLTGQAHARAQS